MEPYVIFRGVSSKSLGLTVTGMPDHVRAGLRATAYNLPGRDDELHVAEGYEATDITITVSAWRQEADIRQIVNAWADGTGDLISSDDLTKCWKGTVLERVRWTRRTHAGGTRFFDEARITFRCKSHMYETVPQVVTVEGGATEGILGMGNDVAFPLIRVTGSGDGWISVNGERVELEGMTAGTPVNIDSETGYVYTAAGAATMRGDFQTLRTGLNTVTSGGGVTSLEITPRWRWL